MPPRITSGAELAAVRLVPTGPARADGPVLAVAAPRGAQMLPQADAPRGAVADHRVPAHADHGLPDAPAPVRHGVVRRIVIGIVLLFVLAGGGAWLMHVSIDPDEAVFGPSDAQQQLRRAAG